MTPSRGIHRSHRRAYRLAYLARTEPDVARERVLAALWEERGIAARAMARLGYRTPPRFWELLRRLGIVDAPYLIKVELRRQHLKFLGIDTPEPRKIPPRGAKRSVSAYDGHAE